MHGIYQYNLFMEKKVQIVVKKNMEPECWQLNKILQFLNN